MSVRVNLNLKGLLNYAKAGKEARKDISKAVRHALNVGRKIARQRISSEFRVRTGFLRRQARKMQTKVSIRDAEIKGQVTPIPRLMNIFEKPKKWHKARPVVTPAAGAMETDARKELTAVMAGIGK